MASKTTLRRRLAFRESALEELYTAYTAILKGKVKSYQIDDRTLTRLDLPALYDEIVEMENEIDGLEAQLNGGSARRAYAVVPSDW